LVINERERVTKDEFFYLMAGILLFLAFIKLVFGRFFTNLFRLFFQPSFRQKQTREQLQQNNLPSLLLNLLFVLSAAAYISFLLDYYKFSHYGFWWLFLYSVAALTIIYIGKFIFLSFAGWVFNVKEATNAYIFAVYLINKILAIVLIPFTLVIAFSDTGIINICITLSILIILLLFIYRYIVSYVPVRKEVKVRPLHFFFYILAFEITPLLVIYKTLLIYLNKSL
jgi:MFS family permease